MTNTADTCDRCVATVQYSVLLPSGLALSFCGHHYHENSEALRQAGATVIETRELVPA